jgi:Flp pilus assembly pilin Flp
MDKLRQETERTTTARRGVTAQYRLMRRRFARLLRDDRGTTSLEWALLLGAIALPSVYIFTMSLGVIVDYYRMMTQITSLPLP